MLLYLLSNTIGHLGESSTSQLLTNICGIIHVYPHECVDLDLEGNLREIFERELGANMAAEALNDFYNSPSQYPIIVDSLDELRGHKKLVDSIYALIKQQRRVVVCGVRTNHSVLKNLPEGDKVMNILVVGFNELSQISYIENFPWVKLTGIILMETKEQLKKLIQTDKKLKGILTNPLSLFLCIILLDEGGFKVSDLKYITKQKLYNAIVNLCIERDNDKSQKEHVIKNLQKFCAVLFKSLVSNQQIYEQELEKGNIDKDIIPFVLAKRREENLM